MPKKKKELKITFVNPNTEEETAKLLIPIVAEAIYNLSQQMEKEGTRLSSSDTSI